MVLAYVVNYEDSCTVGVAATKRRTTGKNMDLAARLFAASTSLRPGKIITALARSTLDAWGNTTRGIPLGWLQQSELRESI
jgi:TRAP-type mannitol/chloroaromatic compound transport system substrate-binding protein